MLLFAYRVCFYSVRYAGANCFLAHVLVSKLEKCKSPQLTFIIALLVCDEYRVSFGLC